MNALVPFLTLYRSIVESYGQDLQMSHREEDKLFCANSFCYVRICKVDTHATFLHIYRFYI